MIQITDEMLDDVPALKIAIEEILRKKLEEEYKRIHEEEFRKLIEGNGSGGDPNMLGILRYGGKRDTDK